MTARAGQWRLRVRVAIAALCLHACGPKVDNSQVKLPAPLQSTTLGPGDVFTLEIVGEKDLPKEYQVASDGSVDFPYVHRLQVQGLEPQQIARAVREQLMGQQILTDPSVIVSVKEYNSKRITVLGEVRKPGSFPLTTGMTLVQAISNAGGLTAIANGDRVNLTRTVIPSPEPPGATAAQPSVGTAAQPSAGTAAQPSAGVTPPAPEAAATQASKSAPASPAHLAKSSTLTVVLSFDAITAGRSPDIPLQAGDQIYVNERVF
ncbi:MAG TPA: polysaccharide biosynthesis/export family protein [Polyangiaceae bacterium]|nr:polysaccharide biosynthesis/export family protein [Polyangiaceae bacterium]